MFTLRLRRKENQTAAQAEKLIDAFGENRTPVQRRESNHVDHFYHFILHI